MNVATRRAVLAGLGALAAGSASAQDQYPSRPIQVIVPATAGGGADIGARRAGELLREALGQTFVIDNRAGAAGSIAAAYVARSEKNGYTVGMATDSSVLINPLVMPDVTYKLEDFQLISPLYMGGMALAVEKNFPASNLAEFIAEVKRRQSLPCAMFGVVSSPRLVAEMFMAEAQIKLDPVPYRGENEAVRDVVAGLVPAFVGTLANLLPQYRAGNLRLLAISFTGRLPALPDVPTFAEAGLKTVVYRWFHGFMFPAGTPAPIVDRFSKALMPVVASEKFKAGLGQDLTPTPMTPAEFTEMAYAARERVKGIIRDRNLKLE
jgi:tripartite-type tricarboxylate transporter receptor subunit TctC